MYLDATTKTLELDLNGAVATNQLPVTVSYVDISQSTFAVTGMGTTDTASNSTTAVTIVAAPAATTTRIVKSLTVKNSDTAAVLLLVQLNDNATLREILKVTLAIGDSLHYEDGDGWKVTDSTGAVKISIGGAVAATTLSASGAVTFGSTLSVTGTSTLGVVNASGLGTFNAGISIPTGQSVTGAGTATVTGFASGSFGTAGNQGSVKILGSTSGTATFSTDATATKVALDKEFYIGSNSLTAGAGAFSGVVSSDASMQVGAGKNKVTIKGQNTQAVANSSTVIWTTPIGNEGGLFVVSGKATAASNYFIDLVAGSDATDSIVVISSSTMLGSPTARTYTWVSDSLKLAMADANTYDITVSSLANAFPD